MSKACIFLAEGFEEIEALTVVDMLRRARVAIDMVSVIGKRLVRGSHGILLDSDILFEEEDFGNVDMLVLPGGMPGTKGLAAHEGLRERLVEFHKAGKWVCAICAAPMILGECGILEGKRAVCHPGFEEHLKGATVGTEKVAVDGNVITSRGMGTAIDFGSAILRALAGEEAEREVREKILAD